jgi:phage-related protein
MPETRVVFYQEADGEAPIVDWLQDLLESNERAWANCRARIELLAQFGHELRGPEADYLRDGIYELRAKQGHVQYRLLYFFHGPQAAILAHALTKEDEVPTSDIERAIERKKLFESNPRAHTYESKD